MTHRVRIVAFLCAIFFANHAVWLVAQTKPAAETFFPPTTALFVHVENPAELISKIENHSVLEKVLQLKPVEEFLKSSQGSMLRIAKGLFENQIDESIWDSLKSNLKNGLWVGFDTKQNGALITFQANDEARLKRVAGIALKFIEQQAKNDGKPVPFKKIKYRDAVAAEFDGFLIARYKAWFFATNQPKLAKLAVDNLMDGTDQNLAQQAWFQKASSERNRADLWSAINLKSVRELAKDKTPYQGQTDNPGLELIFGGVLDVLKHSPMAYVNFNLSDQLSFEISAPFQEDWANEYRDFFFGNQLDGLAPKSLKPSKLIASLTSYRDIGDWWLKKEDLYPENVIAQLAQADSQLSTIFSGMNFGEDVLGALQPGVQLLVTENRYDDKYVPDVKLPAFALVGKLKDAEGIQRRLRIAFQSVIGFANINLGMNGQPQLEVETEKIGGARLSSASYYFEEGTEEGLVLFNFAPTVAFQGDHLILSSTRDLAVEVASLISGDNSNEDSNTELSVDGQRLHDILRDNRESLIAQNMLEEGNDRSEAETQVEVFLAATNLFDELKLDFDVKSNEINLKLNVTFEENSESEGNHE